MRKLKEDAINESLNAEKGLMIKIRDLELIANS